MVQMDYTPDIGMLNTFSLSRKCYPLNYFLLKTTPLSRGYDYVEVLKWFAEKVDLILLLFDAHKLDISDEMRDAVQALRLNEEKIRIVLNKADMIDTDQGGNSIDFIIYPKRAP